LEDQVFPKRCGHLGGKAVIPVEHMVAKVRAACQARSNPETLIIARVDSRSVNGFDDALMRARAYVDAGAEMIFPEALKNAAEFEQFATQLRQTHPHVWLLANMTEFGQTPLYTTEQFGQWGYNLVIFPMTLMRVLQKAMDDALTMLKTEGTQAGFMETMASRQELYELIRYNDYTALDVQLSFQIP
jgi:methylisocitrate lyase